MAVASGHLPDVFVESSITKKPALTVSLEKMRGKDLALLTPSALRDQAIYY